MKFKKFHSFQSIVEIFNLKFCREKELKLKYRNLRRFAIYVFQPRIRFLSGTSLNLRWNCKESDIRQGIFAFLKKKKNIQWLKTCFKGYGLNTPHRNKQASKHIVLQYQGFVYSSIHLLEVTGSPEAIISFGTNVIEVSFIKLCYIWSSQPCRILSLNHRSWNRFSTAET